MIDPYPADRPEVKLDSAGSEVHWPLNETSEPQCVRPSSLATRHSLCEPLASSRELLASQENSLEPHRPRGQTDRHHDGRLTRCWYPFLAIVLGLQLRGHDVLLATGGAYRKKIEGLGLGFRPLRPDSDAVGDPR